MDPVTVSITRNSTAGVPDDLPLLDVNLNLALYQGDLIAWNFNEPVSIGSGGLLIPAPLIGPNVYQFNSQALLLSQLADLGANYEVRVLGPLVNGFATSIQITLGAGTNYTVNDVFNLAQVALADIAGNVGTAGSIVPLTIPLKAAVTLTGDWSANDINTINLSNDNSLADLGTIDGTGITSINGTAQAVHTALDDLNQKPTSFTSVITAGDLSQASDLLAISAIPTNTSVDASLVSSIDGLASDIVLVIDDGAITTPVNFDSVITGKALATDIIYIEDQLNVNGGNGTGSINGLGISDIDGVAADVVQALIDLDTVPTAFNSLITAGAVAASHLNTISLATSGVVNATAVTDINGTAAEVNAAVTDAGITNSGAFNSLIADDVVNTLSLDLNSISFATTGTVDATAVTGIDGTAADVAKVVTDTGITNSGAFAVLIDAGDLSKATDLTTISNATSGLVDASLVANIDGTAAEVVTVINDTGIATPTNFDTVIADETVNPDGTAATDIIYIEDLLIAHGGNGTGSIDGSAITKIYGTAPQVIQALTDLDVDPTNFNVKLTGVATSLDINNIDTLIGTGIIDGQLITDINGTANNVLLALGKIDPALPPTNFSSVLTGVAQATDIIAIEAANGSGTINGAGLIDINGTAANVLTALSDLLVPPPAFNATIADQSIDALHPHGTLAQEIIAIDAANAGGLIDGSSITKLDGTASDVLLALNGDLIPGGLSGLTTDPSVFDVYLQDGAVETSAQNIIDIRGADLLGNIDGSAITNIGGTAVAILNALSDLNVDPTAFNAHITESATFTEISNVDALTSGTITLDATTLTGSAGNDVADFSSYTAVSPITIDGGTGYDEVTASQGADVFAVDTGDADTALVSTGNFEVIHGFNITQDSINLQAAIPPTPFVGGTSGSYTMDGNGKVTWTTTPTDLSEIVNAANTLTADGEVAIFEYNDIIHGLGTYVFQQDVINGDTLVFLDGVTLINDFKSVTPGAHTLLIG